MTFPTRPTTPAECNNAWPEEFNLEFWENESSRHGILISPRELKETIIQACAANLCIPWDEYPPLYRTRNKQALKVFYHHYVVPLVNFLKKIEKLANRQKILLSRERKYNEANLARLVSNAASLQAARYQWLPGNTYGNRWKYPARSGSRTSGHIS